MPRMIVCFSKFARKPQRSLFQRSFIDDIKLVLDPEAEVDRYSRIWHISQWDEKHGYLMGKIGFSSQAKETKTDWDETAHDFIQHEEDSRYSSYVLWVLDLEKQVVAFEIKTGLIEYHSVKGAFEKFFSLHPEVGLTVENYVETEKFLSWVENDIDRMTSFRAILRTPNPDFSKETDYIFNSLEKTNADEAILHFKKLNTSEDSLNTSGTIEEIVDYGSKTGYSTIKAEGKKGSTTKTYDSSKRIPKERTTIQDGISDETKQNLIKNQLKDFIDEK